MDSLIISYFNAGLYNAKDLQTFVAAGELSQDEYNSLVGANSNSASSSASASTAPASTNNQPKSSFNPVQ